jgi:hypothetical protein
MYFIEIHSKDQLLKAHLSALSVRKGIDKILKSENIDTTYYLMYSVDFDKLKFKEEEIDRRKTRLTRKIYKLLNPNIEQIIYYFGPLIIILFLLLIPKNNS